MPNFRSASAIVAVSLLLSLTLPPGLAAAGNAPEPEVPKAWPKWLQKAMKKESRKKKTRPLELGDGKIVTRLMGKIVEEPSAVDGGWFFSANIGSPDEMLCWVFTDPRNPANQLEGIQQALLDETVEANEAKLELKMPYFIDSGVVEGSPYLASEWLYTITTGGGQQVGMTKARVAQKGGATMICAHTVPGYRETFERAFEILVSEATVNLDQPTPYYGEIVEITVGGLPAGVAVVDFTLDEDGDTRVHAMTSLLMRVDANSVLAMDNRKVEFSTPLGMLINAYDTVVQNGELSNNLALNYVDDGWQVDGTFGGKEISVAIDAEVTPLSTLGQMTATRDALRSEEGRALFKAWVPDADPSKFLDASVTIDERGEPLSAATVALGPLVMQAQVDDEGSVVSASLAMGATSMMMSRAVVTGKVPDAPAR